MASLASSICIIRATAHTSWGWHHSTLKMAFHALVCSKRDSAAPAWQPWLSDTNLSSLDCLQNHPLWLVTGQLVSAPLEALRLEADVQSYPTCSKRLILKANEKALRSTDDHPKHIARDVNIPQCLQSRSSFRQKAEELLTLLPPDLQHRENITYFLSPPWQQSSFHVGRVSIYVSGITGRADGNSIKRQFSLTTIASYQADYVIYTDGSASGGTKNRGAAAVVTRRSPLQPDVVTTIKTKGRTFISSYEEEAAAMESALYWTLTNANHHSITVFFCTDSKSLCEALISSHPWTFSIHNSINSILSLIFIQWIPGHSAIPGNDLADKAAKEATTIATDTILSISLSSSIQAINEKIGDAPPIIERVAAVYKHRRVSRDAKQINNRKDDVLIARLRSGHHPSLKQYLHRLDPSQDPTCPNCCQEEQDLLHWLWECPALITVRQRVFWCHQRSLEWLATRLEDVVAYARKTLVNLDT